MREKVIISMSTANKYNNLTNKEIRAYARESLIGNMTVPALVTFFIFCVKNLFNFCASYGIVGKGVPAFIFYIALFILLNTVFGMIKYGINRYFLAFITSKGSAKASEVFGAFTHSTNTILSVSFILTLVDLLCLSPYFIYGFFFAGNSYIGALITLGLYFLGSLFSYLASILFAPIYFIICDYDNIRTPFVFILNFSFMNTFTYFQYLFLQISLLPFYFLGFMSFGIGLLWVIPYAYCSYTFFYESMCENIISEAQKLMQKNSASETNETEAE